MDRSGELPGRDVVHLQRHLGTETVVFAERGARTVGLDISGESIKQARRIAVEQDADVEYIQSNVYDAVAALGGRTFDVVYTGKGPGPLGRCSGRTVACRWGDLRR